MTLKGVYVLRVGVGMNHSLFICRNKDDKNCQALEKFPVLDQSDLAVEWIATASLEHH